MRIVTASNGKSTVKMSKSEWTELGKKAGWVKEAGPKIIKEVPSKIQIATLDNQHLMFHLIIGNGEYMTWLSDVPALQGELQEWAETLNLPNIPKGGNNAPYPA